ncbi:hypothetical protein ACH5RR_006877 [Cinchona calisaya]|uniref:Uncharacterized protein n=1 Tax=Cinchona calisaya TaxID=153742 RepID=A0ABD3AQ80_9GENT
MEEVHDDMFSKKVGKEYRSHCLVAAEVQKVPLNFPKGDHGVLEIIISIDLSKATLICGTIYLFALNLLACAYYNSLVTNYHGQIALTFDSNTSIMEKRLAVAQEKFSKATNHFGNMIRELELKVKDMNGQAI